MSTTAICDVCGEKIDDEHVTVLIRTVRRSWDPERRGTALDLSGNYDLHYGCFNENLAPAIKAMKEGS